MSLIIWGSNPSILGKSTVCARGQADAYRGENALSVKAMPLLTGSLSMGDRDTLSIGQHTGIEKSRIQPS